VSKLRLVGISGAAGVGKDTATHRLVDKHGFVQIALADPIKRFVYQTFDFSEKQLWGPSSLRDKPDSRYQKYCGDSIDESWAAAADRLKENGRNFIQEVVNPATEEEMVTHYASLSRWFRWLGASQPKLTPRTALQSLGTEWGRYEVSESIWVSYTIDVAGKLLGEEVDSHYVYDKVTGLAKSEEGISYAGVAISDIRFPNELRMIQDAGGFLIRIVRDDAPGSVGFRDHASELEQSFFTKMQFNYTIDNNSSLPALHEAIDLCPLILGVKKSQ
jgi:hypothetical protein